MLIAILACEVGFWLVLAAGLVVRYALRRPRLGGALLVGVPLVDLALLVLTVVDLRRGSPVEAAHGLAAAYLGFSVVFGHAMVRAVDVRVAHRFRGGPAPAAKPFSGTWARARREWREFGRAALAAGLSAVLLLGAIAMLGPNADAGPLWGWFPRLGVTLLIWLVAWPLWDSIRALTRSAGASAAGRSEPPRGATP
jgi:hypothetical protein